jgi:hypothetical protein
MSLEDAEREARIDNEIVVDCYTESERALGWYYYLDDKLSFPFKATCVLSLRTSPLRLGEEVQVVSMAEEDNCMREMYVRVEYGANLLELPLRQLLCQSRSRSTQQALQDWYYWQFRGYEF